MTLDRKAISPGARVMMPLCPIFMGKLGLGILFTPLASMTATPAFRTVNDIMPLKTWAVLCILVAVQQVAAILVNRRMWYIYALAVMALSLTGWTIAFVWSFFQHQAPVTAMDWAWFAAGSCVATMVSLTHGSE